LLQFQWRGAGDFLRTGRYDRPAVFANATFQVSTLATPPPAYQWFFNGSGLSGATNNTLTLTNVQPGQTGPYLVVVTNSLGAATSSVAQLTVLVPANIALATPSIRATNLSITLNGVLGLTYRLEYKNLLSDSNWVPILPAVPGTGTMVILQDTNPPIKPSRFYRVTTY
jgi:hypothetical protein